MQSLNRSVYSFLQYCSLNASLQAAGKKGAALAEGFDANHIAAAEAWAALVVSARPRAVTAWCSRTATTHLNDREP